MRNSSFGGFSGVAAVLVGLAGLVGFGATAPSAQAFTGFDTGNEFEWTRIQGTLRMVCHDPQGGNDYRTFYCREDLFDPDAFAYFVKEGSQVDADTVVLDTTWSDGSKHQQKENWDPKKGVSRGLFNLWVMTLLQDPLLEPGANTVRYTFLKKKQPVGSGKFQANVKQLPTRQCPYRSYYSSNPNDCSGSGVSVCRDYFYYENYCQ